MTLRFGNSIMATECNVVVLCCLNKQTYMYSMQELKICINMNFNPEIPNTKSVQYIKL